MVALSITEAEYMVATDAVKEALWIKGFLSEILGIEECITVFCDNQSALHLMKNPVYHERSKHIDIKLHFIRDIVSNGKVKVDKIGTEDNPTDALTKVLPVTRFKYLLSLVNVHGP